MPEFPHSSVAVSTTALLPILAQLKVVGLAAKVTFPQLSVPIPTSLGVMDAVPPLFMKTVASWQKAVGAVLSVNVMIWSADDALPQASVAVQVRVIVPSDGQPPAKAASEKVMVTDAVQLSVAVAVPVAAGEESASHSTVASAGAEIAGGVVSKIVMI